MNTTDKKAVGRPVTGRKQSLQVQVDPDFMSWLQDLAGSNGESVSSCARRLLLQVKRDSMK